MDSAPGIWPTKCFLTTQQNVERMCAGRFLYDGESPMKRKQVGFSLIELLIVVAIILIIAAIALPNLMVARMSANEASAVQSLRTIQSAKTAMSLPGQATGLRLPSAITSTPIRTYEGRAAAGASLQTIRVLFVTTTRPRRP